MAKVRLDYEVNIDPLKQAGQNVQNINREAVDLGQTMTNAFRQSTTEASKFDKQIENTIRDVDKLEKQATGGFGRVGKTLNDTTKHSETLGSSFKNMATGFVAGTIITAGIQKITGALSNVIEVQKQFEKSIQNLSAITGASGKDLQFYSDQALKLGSNIKGGAVAAVEAFKLIGSAKPELLENKEALIEVTKSAILLSQAAGLELPDAATRLTDAMNQFGAASADAGKFVDTLAAGAKFGAAEVPDITEALLKFGVGAKAANININESVAAIELLGEKGLKGAEAGTKLRNVFLNLSNAKALPKEAQEQLKKYGVDTDILSDKTKTLNQRLVELSKIKNDSIALEAVFGKENQNSAQAVLQNTERLAELTKQIGEQGLGSALEQATKNMDTLDQKTIEASNAWDNFTLTLTKSGTGDILKTIVEGFTASLDTLTQVIGGTKGQTDDALNIMASYNIVLSKNTKITEEQAMQLAQYGLTLNRTTGNLDAAKKATVDYLALTDQLTKGIEGARNTEENRNKLLKIFQTDAAIFAAQNKAGVLSTEAFLVKIKILNAQVAKVKSAGLKGSDIIPPPDDTVIEKTKVDLDKLKKLREDYEKAILDLRKRVEKAQLDQATPKAKIELERTFAQEELDLYQAQFIKIATLNDKNFQLSLQQQEQFNFLRNAINLKAAEAQIKLEVDTANKIQQTKLSLLKGKSSNLNLEEQNAISAVSLAPNTNAGVSEKDFEILKQKQIIAVQQEYAIKKLELKKQELAQEREVELKGLNGELALLQDKDDEESNRQRQNVRDRLAILEEKYALESTVIQDSTAKVINDLEKQREELDKKQPLSLKNLFGLNKDQISALKQGIGEIINLFQTLLDAQLSSNQQTIDESKKKQETYDSDISDLQSKLSDEKSLRDEGLANNTDRIQAEIDAKEAAKQREKEVENQALQERKRLQKEQLLLDTISQASNLFTAATEIYVGLAKIDPTGIAGTIAVAAMVAAFALQKAAALKAINEGNNFAKGKIGIEGPGTETSDSIPANLSKGESVLTAKVTKKRRNILEAMHSEDERKYKIALIKELENTGVVLDKELPRELSNKKDSIKNIETSLMFQQDNSKMEKQLADVNKVLELMNQEQRNKTYLDEKGNLVKKIGTHTVIIRKKQ